MKSWTPTPKDIQSEWWVVDAEGKTLGRLASQVAHILKGKHKPSYAPHMDVGDFVIITNCDKIRVTGRRMDDKMYYRHTGYHGGLRTTSLRDMLDRRPERVLELAIKRMLPKNRLGRQMYRKLKVYAGTTHPHEAQQPKKLEIEG
ncbi:MAG: 50S ribosomal protein L13 [Anaerolineae bacterium]|nr:50S ribosomal protein L13 [Anaerolineae bacterium]